MTRLALFAALTILLLPHAAQASACRSGYDNPVIRENCEDSGSWSSAWRVDRSRYVYDPDVLAGYASQPSVNRGESIHFYVRSPQKPAGFKLDFYRLGWYGSKGGRLLASESHLNGTPQPGCHWQNEQTVDAYYTCSNWKVTYSLQVPEGWTSGVYLAVMTSVATAPAPEPPGMAYRYSVVFVVRDDQRKADFLYQQAVATEQAYNDGYGPGLYNTQLVHGNKVPIAKASFERPFDALDNLQFYRFELPLIYWLERQGYDVAYTTDIDTHERTSPLRESYKALLVGGHSEYWSKRMYDSVQSARDSGVHLGFFSGDTLYWQMRLEEETAAPGDETHLRRDRVMVVYRKPYPPNPQGLGDPNPDPSLQTIYWRDFPLLRDEEALVGVHFTHPFNCREHLASWASNARPPQNTNDPATQQTEPQLRSDPQPFTVEDDNTWVFAGTGLRKGDMIEHTYGQEADAFEHGKGAPECGSSWSDPPARPPAYRAGTLHVLSYGRFDNVTPGLPATATHEPVNSVIYQACSGAWVFAAGDVMWGNALAPSFLLGKDYSSLALEQITRNALDVFAGRGSLEPSGGACVGSFPTAVSAIVTLALSD